MEISDALTTRAGTKDLSRGKDGKGAEFTDPMTGETIDLSKARSSGETKNLKHLTEVVEDEGGKGVLRVGDIRCPKCDKNEIFVILMQTEARMSRKLRCVPVKTVARSSGVSVVGPMGLPKDERPPTV